MIPLISMETGTELLASSEQPMGGGPTLLASQDLTQESVAQIAPDTIDVYDDLRREWHRSALQP